MPKDEKGLRREGKLGGEPHEATDDTTDCDATKAKAQALLNDAVSWRERHGDAWSLFCDVLLDEADAGRRAPAKLGVEEIRRRSFPSFPSIYSPVSNELAPAFGRMFCAEYPDAAPFVELRPSILDTLNVDWGSLCRF